MGVLKGVLKKEVFNVSRLGCLFTRGAFDCMAKLSVCAQTVQSKEVFNLTCFIVC